MSGFSEHTIFWLTLSSDKYHGVEFGGIYGNSEKEQKSLKTKIWERCQKLTDHDMTEKRLDEELDKWQKEGDKPFNFTYTNRMDLLFSIEMEMDDNEEVARALLSTQSEDVWVYRKFAMVGNHLSHIVKERVATPDLFNTPERIVLEDPVTFENEAVRSILYGHGHLSLPLHADFKSFVSKDKAITHAEPEFHKERDSLWTENLLPMEGEHNPWVGIVRVECPVKDEDGGKNRCNVLARVYTVCHSRYPWGHPRV